MTAHKSYKILKSTVIFDVDRLTSDYLEDLLIGYGLTKNQSKILSVLIQNNRGITAKQISQNTNLARESVYRSLLTLKKIGLVEKTIEFPKKYLAIPLKSVLSLLHEQKSLQIHELEKLTTQVLMQHHKRAEANNIKEKTHFILVPKRKQLVNRISKAISNSKKSIKIITTWERYSKGAIIYNKAFKKALSNGAKLQVLVLEKPKKAQLSKEGKFFPNHPNSSFKFTESPANVIHAIIDDQEIFLMTDPKAKLLESPALWSNNRSLIMALSACFNSVWESN